MTRPKAYSPEQGYRYQLLCKSPYDRAYEHLDYAKDKTEKKHLLDEYKLAFSPGFSYTTIELPQKYWPCK